MKNSILGLLIIVALGGISLLFIDTGKGVLVEKSSKRELEEGQGQSKKERVVMNQETQSRAAVQSIDVQKPDWPFIEEQLKSPDSSTRFLVAQKLGKIRQKKSVDLLLGQLESKELSTRIQAANSIEELVGYKIKKETLSDEAQRAKAVSEIKKWWKADRYKSFNQHRLDQLKKKSAK